MQTVAAGTSGNVLTDNGTTWTSTALSTLIKGLGFGGTTWHDVTGSRVTGTVYTNSNTYPIMVSISMLASSSGGYSTSAIVNGITVATCSYGGATGTWEFPTSFNVPPGQTYYIIGRGFSQWSELY